MQELHEPKPPVFRPKPPSEHPQPERFQPLQELQEFQQPERFCPLQELPQPEHPERLPFEKAEALLQPQLPEERLRPLLQQLFEQQPQPVSKRLASAFARLPWQPQHD